MIVPRPTSASPARRRLLVTALFLSGAAGLAYEVIWTRYLALVVGHASYAQVLVLVVYMGGGAGGFFIIARRTGSIRRPGRAYAWVEGLLALTGLAFHLGFVAATRLGWEVLLPALPGAA